MMLQKGKHLSPTVQVAVKIIYYKVNKKLFLSVVVF